MFRSLKVKFTAAFGALIVVLFLFVGLFLIDSKARELTSDINDSVQLFSQLSADSMMESYFNFLEPGSFIPFQSALSSLIRKNESVDSLSIYTYGGETLFDSIEEFEERYSGVRRTVAAEKDLERIQANHLSLLAEDGRVVYVKQNQDQSMDYVDANEHPVVFSADRNRIVNVMVPYDNAYALSYGVSYDELDARLAVARRQIVIVALLGLLLTLMLSFVMSSTITKPVAALKRSALRLGDGDFKAKVKVTTKDEIGVLGKTFNKMAKDLEAATEARVYQERVQKELELAAQIQQELLPADKKELEHLDIAGGLVPASEVGGDAFDYIEMDNGKHLFYLGDVTGHGVAAGIVSSIANAMLYGLRGEKDISNVIHKLNDVIRAKTTAKVFITMALTFWDEKKRSLSYINAGHPAILYFDATKKKVIEVNQQGVALGFVENMTDLMKPQDIKLKNGDFVVMYSDGVPEAVNKKGEQYGMIRFKRIVQDAGNDLYTSEGIKNAVLSDVIEFIGAKEHDDDITVVVLKGKN